MRKLEDDPSLRTGEELQCEEAIQMREVEEWCSVPWDAQCLKNTSPTPRSWRHEGTTRFCRGSFYFPLRSNLQLLHQRRRMKTRHRLFSWNKFIFL
ncbi:Hypothetical predicted protein [Scomber scombrus]|uniref:Uncharacterized protein n=1 Tax=Scomber scombrus TaxID=13677 RepID=A0AAV1PN08_SCOSC